MGFVVLLLALLTATGCKKNKSDTTLATLRLKDFEGSFSKLFVMGVGKNDERRRLYEDSLVSALDKEGVAAQASYEVFPQSEKLEKEEVLRAVREGGFDAVVVTHVIWVSRDLKYVPGKTRRIPTSSSNIYSFTYEQAYETVHEPGYYENYATYSVETMLFSVSRNGEKVWSALSETVNPESIEKLIDSVVAVVVRGMKDDGLLQ